MTSWPIIGHTWAVDLLARSIKSGHISHAYLFTGPEGVGKTTLARVFAQALLCEGEEPPCGECRSCRHVAAGVHPDMRLVEPHEGLLRIEQVREVTREASRRPVEARRRVFILTHMERAHPAAANALLKTLEEPPAHVVIILTAPSEEAILPTLVSRCRVMALRPVPEEEIRRALEERWGDPPERARLLARLSGGRPGWAIRAREDEAFWALRDTTFDLVATFAQNRTHWVRLEIAEQWSRANRETQAELLSLLQMTYRDILVIQEGQQGAIRNVDKVDLLTEWAEHFSREQIRNFLRRLMDVQKYMQKNINVRLALDVLFLSAPR